MYDNSGLKRVSEFFGEKSAPEGRNCLAISFGVGDEAFAKVAFFVAHWRRRRDGLLGSESERRDLRRRNDFHYLFEERLVIGRDLVLCERR
ncbi:MAG: hypothetical protein J6K20_07725 [Thermoguttaceae bacterium]|nr:hypothetical protein [Thermoguttaceae bacterium]